MSQTRIIEASATTGAGHDALPLVMRAERKYSNSLLKNSERM
jgi:hypothetical protein